MIRIQWVLKNYLLNDFIIQYNLLSQEKKSRIIQFFNIMPITNT